MAVSDHQGPTLTSLAFSVLPNSGGSAYVTVTAGATDDGTGVRSIAVDLDRASAIYGTAFTTLSIPGNSVLFAEGPQSAHSNFDISFGGGTYGIADVIVTDNAGNVTVYSPAQLQSIGLPTAITVGPPIATSIDNSVPMLTGLIMPRIVDASSLTSSSSAIFSATATDSGSGPHLIELDFDHGLSVALRSDSATPFLNALTFDSSSHPQAYTLQDVEVYDAAGNRAIYTPSQIQAMGFATTFTVTNSSATDITPPVLTAIDIPGAVDVSRGTSYPTITANVTETGSGVAEIALQLSADVSLDYPYQYAPHGGVYGGPVLSDVLDAKSSSMGGFYGASLVLSQTGDSYSFTFPDGRSASGVPISALTSAGTYHVIGATVTDVAGNSSSYTEAQLQALGANTLITITADETPPLLTNLTLPTIVITNGAAQTVAFSIGALDLGTGISDAVIHFDRPIGYTGYYSAYDSSHLDFGPYNFTDGNTATVNQNFYGSSAHGTYNVLDVALTDKGGNQSFYSAEQLRAMGFSTSFVVAGSVAQDFNGDGHSDILWLNHDGAVSTWSATGTGTVDQIQENTYFSNVAASWTVKDSFDWNGDGAADLIWRNANGNLSIWTGSAEGFQQSAFNETSVPQTWTIAAAGDLDGDGKGDLLWRNVDGSISTWLSTGSGYQENAYFHNAVSATWKIEGVGDFNGDGKADILWRNDNGALSVWNSTGTGFQESSVLHSPIDRSWHVVGIGDFDADGKDDILWHNDNGAVSVWLGGADDFAENRFNATAPLGWNVAKVGDFEGDGYSDILWRNSSGAISIWQSVGQNSWNQDTYHNASVGNDWVVAGHTFLL